MSDVSSFNLNNYQHCVLLEKHILLLDQTVLYKLPYNKIIQRFSPEQFLQTFPCELLERLDSAPRLQNIRSLTKNLVLALTAENCVATLDEDAREQSRLFCLDEMGLPYPPELL